MDNCIRTGVLTSESVLPGRLQLRRRAPALYRRLMRGSVCFFHRSAFSLIGRRFYPAVSTGHLPVIDGPNTNTAINEPENDNFDNARASTDDSVFTPLSRTRLSKVHSRPPRVVGAFDHPILPMPPVRMIIKCIFCAHSHAIHRKRRFFRYRMFVFCSLLFFLKKKSFV